MRFRAFSFGLLGLLLFLGAAAPAFATRVRVMGPMPLDCKALFKKLPPLPSVPDLKFLPSELRVETRRVVARLRAEAKQSITEPAIYSYSSDLKQLVDRLQDERRLRVSKAVELRARRRALRDRLLMAQSRRSANEEITAQVARLNQGLSAALEENSHELDALIRAITTLRQALGVSAIYEGGRRAAKRLNAEIILHHIHPAAAGQLTHKGKGKGMRFKFNSADDGVIAGLVPYDQSLSSKVARQGPEVVAAKQKQVDDAIRDGLVVKTRSQVGSLVAVKQNGTTVFVDTDRLPVRENEIAYVLEEVHAAADGQNALIVSDIDPAAIAFPVGSAQAKSPAQATSNLGIISDPERQVLAAFNHDVADALQRRDDVYRYMTHGTEARNPASAGPTGYPMTAIAADGTVRVIEQGPKTDPHRHYREYIFDARARGYEVPINPLWGWDPVTLKPPKAPSRAASAAPPPGPAAEIRP